MQNDFQDTVKNSSFQKVAGLYNIGKTIGKGHFAVVKEACHVITQEKVAIKIIDKTQLDQISKDQLLSEVMCMKLVQHPNIVRLYEVIDTVNKLYLILELGDGGDLYDYITTNGCNGLCEEEAKRYFRQILRAIGYCHKLHVVHRDIKPENVVFFKQLELVKLTDFGFSNKFVPGGMLSTSCGSLAYSAPEILLGDAYDAPKVDIWSLGVILFMLVVGSLPFNETNDSETVAKIMDCRYSIPSYVTADCQNLIKKMLVRDAMKRATLDEIINDHWLQIVDNDDEYELENYSVPLLDREQLTFEEHLEIMTKMSDENLASIDAIQRILDANEFNHISATYFLLAERKLKRRFVEEYLALKSKHERAKISTQNNEKLKTVMGSPAAFDGTRRISMILEGEENEENEAITSLAFVRRELENFVADIDGNNLPGTTARNSSRCMSRISSAVDLHSLSDGCESDNGAIAIRQRTRLRSSNYHSNSPINSRPNTDAAAAVDAFFEREQYPVYEIKKSFSVTDLSDRKQNNVSLDNMKNSVHKFSIGSNTSRYSSNSANYREIKKIALNERRSTQISFDTGSNSTTANCSSADNSDIENDVPKKKSKNLNKNIDKPILELLDVRDICEPIKEEGEINMFRKGPFRSSNKSHSDCYRSQSFDGRLRNNVQLDCVSARGVLPTKLKYKSQSNSWHRNSVCSHLADSNFSLSSMATKLENQNMMQVIRGAIELQLHHRNSTPGCNSPIKPASSSPPTCSKSTRSTLSPKITPRNIYKHIRSTFPKLKKPNLFYIPKTSHSKSSFRDHSGISTSNSCHLLSVTKAHSAPPTFSTATNSISSQCLPQSNYSIDHKLNKSDDLFVRKNNLACCLLS